MAEESPGASQSKSEEESSSPERLGQEMAHTPPPPPPPGPPVLRAGEMGFVRRVLLAVGLAVLAVTVALFLWYAIYVLLLAFAGVLIAVALRSSADWVSRKTGLGEGWSLAGVILGLAGFFVAVGWLAGPSLVRQVDELTNQLPGVINAFETQVLKYGWGRQLLGRTTPPGADNPAPAVNPDTQSGQQPPQGDEPAAGGTGGTGSGGGAPPESSPQASNQDNPPKQDTPSTRAAQPPPGNGNGNGGGIAGGAINPQAVLGTAQRYLQLVIQAVVTVVVVLVVGIYLAASPRLYTKGLLHLVPHPARPRVGQVLSEVGYVLKWWLLGQLVPMAVIGVFTALGLWLIGIPMWFLLGLLAALFNFIPNFGPVISFIPAALLALATGDPSKILWVALLYLIAQCLEGYVLTPLVQRKAVELPPVLTILGQVLMGILAGGLGVVLAAPLMAAAVVVVQMLYVQDALGDPVQTPREGQDRSGPDQSG